MPKILKYIGYLIVFVFFFFIFLYWMFPYNILKDRVAAAIEEPLGRKVEVSIGDIEPYYFTGVSISKLKLISHKDGRNIPILELDKVRARASLFSLLFGNPNITFYIRAKKGEIEGRSKQIEEGFDIDVDFDDFEIGTIKWLQAELGLNLTGKLNGNVDLKIDRMRPTRSKGKIDVDFESFKLVASNLVVGGTAIPLPTIVFSKSKGSGIKLEIDKGSATLKELKFTEGDLQLNLKGKVFLSTTLSNYRLNLRGSFRISEALKEAIPFLFMAESQKQKDGSYPLAITGRISRPTVKVGTFTLPF